MQKEGKFGPQEAMSLIMVIIISRQFFFSLSTRYIKFVGTAAWQMILVSALTAAIGFTFIYLLLKRFNGKNIIQIFEIVFGSYLSFIFSALLALQMILNAGFLMADVAEDIKTYSLPLSPLAFPIIIFIPALLVFLYLGLETIVRFSRIWIILVVGSIAAITLLAIPNYFIHQIFPIFGYGIKGTIYYGTIMSSMFGDVIILAVIAPSLQGLIHIKKAGYRSILYSGLILSILYLFSLLLAPYYSLRELLSPTVIPIISFGKFLERIDAFLFPLWYGSGFLSIISMTYVAISIYSKMFHIQDIQPLIIPTAIILFTIAMIPKDFPTIIVGYILKTRMFGGIISYLLPVITLITALIRKKQYHA